MREWLLSSISAATAICSFAVALFFARFYHTRKDRLFGLFALGFVFLGVNRLALMGPFVASENRPYLYILRLVAFSLIAFAVVDKNRPADR